MNKILSYYFALGIIILMLSCQNKTKKPIVHCASGAIMIVEDIRKSNENSFVINSGATGTLARQINSGIEGAVIISADKDWMDYLIEKNKVDSSAVKPLAENHLVLCQSKDYVEGSAEKIKIAIGNPDYVPAGKYAIEALRELGSFDENNSEVILTKDVASAAQLLSQGEVDYAVLYSSVAAFTKNIKLVQILDELLVQPIYFYIAPLLPADSKKEEIVTLISSSRLWDSKGFTALNNNR